MRMTRSGEREEECPEFDSGEQSTMTEMEADISIEASLEEVTRAVVQDVEICLELSTKR